eukprot:TRINITY_DN59539_c0_g1_i1.p1 TRINITY_DN59539_c0_g1~~TRINITY_DN59539_c0_g1_i1.p1  ORF type:complete len:468 (+),score=94.61 TRINITY_DN59539_c0_g1_i1:79-1404(+)
MARLNLISDASVWARNAFVQWRFGGKGKDKVSVVRNNKNALAWWPLMQPLEKEGVAFKHRVVVAGMTRMRNDPETLGMSEMAYEWYRQRASGGGLVVTEAMSVTEGSQMRVPRIINKEQMEALRGLREVLGDSASNVAPQLYHPGRGLEANRVSTLGENYPESPPDGFSTSNYIDIKELCLQDKPVQEATLETIQDVRRKHKRSCELVKEAGFGRVDFLFGGSGFVQDSLLARTNPRTDRYGKNPEGRSRLAREIIDDAAQIFGPSNVGVTLHLGFDIFGMVQNSSTDNPTYLTLAAHMEKKKIGYLHVWNRYKDKLAPASNEFVKSYEEAPRFFSALRKTYTGVLIESGYRDDFSTPSNRIASEEIDAAAFGTAFVVAPDLPNRIRHGVSIDKEMQHLMSVVTPNDFILSKKETPEKEAKNYIDWRPADLPEEAPEVISL